MFNFFHFHTIHDHIWYHFHIIHDYIWYHIYQRIFQSGTHDAERRKPLGQLYALSSQCPGWIFFSFSLFWYCIFFQSRLKKTFSCSRGWRLSANVCAPLYWHSLKPPGPTEHTIVLRGLRGALYWLPMMHWENNISISFHIEWDMIVVIVFLSILNQM